MTTTFDNLVQYFGLVILELEQLKLQGEVPEEQEDKIWESLNKTGDVCIQIFEAQIR